MTEMLEAHLTQQNLSVAIDLPAIIRQINKDISQSGGMLEINDSLSLNDAFDVLHTNIQKWLTTNELDVRSLLYRIDVSESDILKAGNTPEEITTLIFKREIIKIRFRKEYS